MTIMILGNKEETIKKAAEHWIAQANQAIEKRGAFFVALSGGSTPYAIFAELKKQKNCVNWNHVWLFWGDERSVEPTNIESNYLMAMNAGMSSLGIPEKQIFRMRGEILDAEGYESAIRSFVPDAIFDLIMLGMGDDGHTASLFPNTEAIKEKERFVVVNAIPEKNCNRLTFTYPLINRARLAVFYVLGSGKAQKIYEIFVKKEVFPASKVKANDVLWILDEEAAILLSNMC